MKVDENNVPKPTSNDELIENSDQVPIKSHTLIDEPTEVQVLRLLYTQSRFFFFTIFNCE